MTNSDVLRELWYEETDYAHHISRANTLCTPYSMREQTMHTEYHERTHYEHSNPHTEDTYNTDIMVKTSIYAYIYICIYTNIYICVLYICTYSYIYVYVYIYDMRGQTHAHCDSNKDDRY